MKPFDLHFIIAKEMYCIILRKIAKIFVNKMFYLEPFPSAVLMEIIQKIHSI